MKELICWAIILIGIIASVIAYHRIDQQRINADCLETQAMIPIMAKKYPHEANAARLETNIIQN